MYLAGVEILSVVAKFYRETIQASNMSVRWDKTSTSAKRAQARCLVRSHE